MIAALQKSMAAKRDRLESDKGFTLIELLVVVLIIGVLAAIAIPVFIGQQQTAQDGAAKSDLANAKIAVIAAAAADDGTFPTTTDGLSDYGFVSSTANTPVMTVGDNGVFCLSVASASGTTFAVSDVVAPAAGTCSDEGVYTAPE